MARSRTTSRYPRLAGGHELTEDQWARIEDRKEVTASGCWLWTGDRNAAPQDYGKVVIDSRNYYVHILSLTRHLGRPVAPGFETDHRCDTPRCFNPAHLRELTHSENVARYQWKVRAFDLDRVRPNGTAPWVLLHDLDKPTRS